MCVNTDHYFYYVIFSHYNILVFFSGHQWAFEVRIGEKNAVSFSRHLRETERDAARRYRFKPSH